MAVGNRKSKTLKAAVVVAVASLSVGVDASDNALKLAQERRLDIAEFDDQGRLQRPDNIDEWIFLGASVGHGYPEGEKPTFTLENPGSIQVVQMEPNAYRYLQQHGDYADGTMIALSFYSTQDEPAPRVDGLVQQDLVSFEIHLLDSSGFADRRAFYLFGEGEEFTARLPDGNSCVSCHREHADYRGTFVQFYPLLRDHRLARVIADKGSD